MSDRKYKAGDRVRLTFGMFSDRGVVRIDEYNDRVWVMWTMSGLREERVDHIELVKP